MNQFIVKDTLEVPLWHDTLKHLNHINKNHFIPIA